jgi:hypothetical protein
VDLKEIKEAADWIHLAYDKSKWLAVVNTNELQA